MQQYLNIRVLQAYLAIGDIDSALMSLTKASNIEPNDSKTIYHLLCHGLIYTKSNIISVIESASCKGACT